MSNTYDERFTKQLGDPMGLAVSVGKLACDLYNNKQDNSKEVEEVYQDILKVIGAINSLSNAEYISVNGYITNKYPEIIDISCIKLEYIPLSTLENNDSWFNRYTLSLMLDPLYKIMDTRKNRTPKSALGIVAKAALGHVAMSALMAALPKDEDK